MEDKEKNEQKLLQCLITIPKNMMSIHGVDNIAEFLLHSLCTSGCLNFSKAAFFIDNPDFDQIKGVTGFVHHEAFKSGYEHWHDPENFTKHMGASFFNQKVRSILKRSAKKSVKLRSELLDELGKELAFSKPLHASWPLKYENEGILLFELNASSDPLPQEHIENMLHFFAFCPAF